MKILSIFGTRPEAIKMAPVLRELKRRIRRDRVRSVVCVTAQHREMLDQILTTFRIAPDIDLQLMAPNQSLASLSARALLAISEVLDQQRPDLVLVQGDTTTAMVASMAAFYLKIPVGHIEAGLRTRDPQSPFPEEANRRIISVMAKYHFAPTPSAMSNLRAEGVLESQVFLTGNTVIDALLGTTNNLSSHETQALISRLHLDLPSSLRTILVTLHRREKHGHRLEAIFSALRSIADRNLNVQLIYPVHLNPNVREPAMRILSGHDRIHLVDPLPYETFAQLLKRCRFVMTDSGGIQEEAPALRKPVLVLRDDTERPEAVAAGCAKLVGTGPTNIVAAAEQLLHDEIEYHRMSQVACPYGDGRAAQRIVDIICGNPTCAFIPSTSPHLSSYPLVPPSLFQN
jgi:UDP-N-acetylglucosamine 2-epimerase